MTRTYSVARTPPDPRWRRALLLLLPLGLLACPAPPADPSSLPDTRGAILSPGAAEALATSCEDGVGEACARLGATFRRAWAESLVQAAQGTAPDADSREAGALHLLARACDMGSKLACRDLGARSAWGNRVIEKMSLTEPRLPLIHAMTLRDEQGIGCPGVKVRVGAAGDGAIVSDVHGRVLVPESAIVNISEYDDVSYEGPPAEQLVLTSMRGASLVPLRESPWPEDDVTATLEGGWRRQPNPSSDRSRGWSFPFGFELPGTTGGGERPESPPDRLRFTMHDTPGLSLNGDPVVLVVGLGVVRVELGRFDEWLIPVDADTLVLPEYRTEGWDYAEVYRRE